MHKGSHVPIGSALKRAKIQDTMLEAVVIRLCMETSSVVRKRKTRSFFLFYVGANDMRYPKSAHKLTL